MELLFREIRQSDCQTISEAFEKQGWDKPVSQFEKYLALQKNGARDVIVAIYNDQFSGYLTIQWQSNYPYFKENGIPEIVDFNVLKKYQRHRIGSKLMDEAESRIKQKSNVAGIGFGLYKDYGPAQILYIKRGYIPDGNGVMVDEKSVQKGAKLVIDDSLVLMLTKQL